MEASQLWQQLAKDLFRNVDETFLSNFREPGRANSRLAAWDPLDRTQRFFKFLLFNQCERKPDSFFALYERLGNTSIGNPVVIRVVRAGRSVEVNIDHFFSVEEYCFLSENLDISRIKSVIEIGGGFGRTAQALIRLSNSVESYTIIDLPEVLRLSSLYLKAVLNDHEFGKVRFISAFSLADGVDAVPDRPDLVINIDSLQEMTPQTIDFYMDNVVKKARYFYSKNAIGKYRPETIGVGGCGDGNLKDVFMLGRSRDVIDIFCNSELDDARARHVDAYRPSRQFVVEAEAPLGMFPYYHNVLYNNRGEQA